MITEASSVEVENGWNYIHIQSTSFWHLQYPLYLNVVCLHLLAILCFMPSSIKALWNFGLTLNFFAFSPHQWYESMLLVILGSSNIYLHWYNKVEISKKPYKRIRKPNQTYSWATTSVFMKVTNKVFCNKEAVINNPYVLLTSWHIILTEF